MSATFELYPCFNMVAMMVAMTTAIVVVKMAFMVPDKSSCYIIYLGKKLLLSVSVQEMVCSLIF